MLDSLEINVSSNWRFISFYREKGSTNPREIIRLLGDKFQLMKTRVSLKTNKPRKIYKRLLSHRDMKTKPAWSRKLFTSTFNKNLKRRI